MQPATEDSKEYYKLVEPIKMLMADYPMMDVEIAESLTWRYVPHGFNEPAPEPIWAASDENKGRLAYISCREDVLIPKDRQVEMARAAGCRVLETYENRVTLLHAKVDNANDKITNFARQFVKEELESAGGPQTLEERKRKTVKTMFD